MELHQQGLIYRDKRLVNWDPHFQTAISDLEVENRETQGHFWHFAYPLADGSGELVVADVEHAQRPLHFDREVDVAGRVDDVDRVLAPVAVRRRGLDRDALLFLHVFENCENFATHSD